MNQGAKKGEMDSVFLHNGSCLARKCKVSHRKVEKRHSYKVEVEHSLARTSKGCGPRLALSKTKFTKGKYLTGSGGLRGVRAVPVGSCVETISS